MKQLLVLFLLIFAGFPVLAQSTNESFPSPVVTNEVSGKIAPRDVGDARLTRHYYVFYSNVGDLFLEIESENLNGDIDLFEAATLRPLSKISIYASSNASKTSRIVYFRKREKVVMRVEGRTPNDEPAKYRIGFSGTFAAATDLPRPPEDLESKVDNALSPEAVARVNSVGAIIETLPPKQKPVPEKRAEESAPEKEDVRETEPKREPSKTATARTRQPRRTTTAARRTPAVKTEENKEAEENKKETAKTAETRITARTPPRRNAPRRPSTTASKNPKTTEPAPNPLDNIRLLIILKDGNRIERPMSDRKSVV